LACWVLGNHDTRVSPRGFSEGHLTTTRCVPWPCAPRARHAVPLLWRRNRHARGVLARERLLDPRAHALAHDAGRDGCVRPCSGTIRATRVLEHGALAAVQDDKAVVNVASAAQDPHRCSSSRAPLLRLRKGSRALRLGSLLAQPRSRGRVGYERRDGDKRKAVISAGAQAL